jgi:hypothetical protein
MNAKSYVPFVRPDVLRRDRVDVTLHVACEELLELLPLDVVLGRGHPLEVVEGELGVDRDESVDLDRGIHALAAREAVLDLVRAGREPVAKEVLEQQLAEAAARLGRPQDLLQLAELLRLRGHLHRRLTDLAELAVDGVRLFRRVFEPAVDLRVELAQPPVHRRGDRLQAAVDLRVPHGEELVQGPGGVRPVVGQAAAQPQPERGAAGGEQDDE